MTEEVEVLLVEDNSSDAEMTIRALRQYNLGNRLFRVEDGAQALDFIGSKIKSLITKLYANKTTRSEQAREFLINVVLCHIPVNKFNFRMKVIYIAVMIRRMIIASHDRGAIDDKDYYGNKRLECAG